MQLQRFTERHAAKLVRIAAAFLSGATLSATSASATQKGTTALTPVSKLPSWVSQICHCFGCSACPVPPPHPIAVKPCLLQSRIDASDSAIVLLLVPVCLCLFLTSTTCVVFTDLVLTDVGTHKQNQTCMQSLQVTATCVLLLFCCLTPVQT